MEYKFVVPHCETRHGEYTHGNVKAHIFDLKTKRSLCGIYRDIDIALRDEAEINLSIMKHYDYVCKKCMKKMGRTSQSMKITEINNKEE